MLKLLKILRNKEPVFFRKMHTFRVVFVSSPEFPLLIVTFLDVKAEYRQNLYY